jgi:RNA polymerase sigma factor (sigma-70 family)
VSRPPRDPAPLTDAQQALVKAHLPMVERVARLVLRRCPTADAAAVRRAAHEALTAAARAHDPARDGGFRAFAWRRLFDAAQDAARGHPARTPPIAAARRAGLDMAAALRDETSVFSGAAAEPRRHVDQSLDEVAAAFAIGFVSPGAAAGLIQRHGEDGLVWLEEHARFLHAWRAALASLPPELAQVFQLRCAQRLPARLVAEALGLSKSTVDRRVRKALARLRSVLAAQKVTRAPSLPSHALPGGAP